MTQLLVAGVGLPLPLQARVSVVVAAPLAPPFSQVAPALPRSPLALLPTNPGITGYGF
jgi:hypothetical protein